MVHEAKCAFCGASAQDGRLLFSGRPRARQLGHSTPFACAECVKRAAGRAEVRGNSAECTFCGRQASPQLTRMPAGMCGSCVEYCASIDEGGQISVVDL